MRKSFIAITDSWGKPATVRTCKVARDAVAAKNIQGLQSVYLASCDAMTCTYNYKSLLLTEHNMTYKLTAILLTTRNNKLKVFHALYNRMTSTRDRSAHVPPCL